MRRVPRVLIAVGCGVGVIGTLALPVDWALRFLGSPADRAVNLSLVLGLVALLGAIGLSTKRWVTLLFVIPLLIAMLLVRLLFYGLVHFSGQGFGPELFVHLEPESIRIAWYEYDNLVYRAGGVAVLGALAFLGLLRAGSGLPMRPAALLGVAILALPVLIAGRDLLPEWRLWQAWQDWQQPAPLIGQTQDETRRLGDPARPTSLPAKATDRWHRTGLVETDLTPVDELWAEAPQQPKNLILLYVEGLTSSIIEHPDYRDLMPNFRRLQREHGWIDTLHTSGFVTIEGLANSQCGTLFPFRGRGSGFAGRQMLAQSLPCLGDVLAEAGYEQVYLGGSPMSFTGKGRFLDAHGYEELKGWEYWRSQGYENDPGHWGLGDVALLEKIREEIAERQKRDRPFNVTALTVGTHIPGYTYESCARYRGGRHRFLDALHCTDQVVADWIGRLHDDNLLADSVLVIVGDHPVFANPDMKNLFGPAIYRTGMPMIVMGDVDKSARHERGASVDLAPTLLDLLDVRTNAEFAMGESLADVHDRPDYLVTRRVDLHQGQPVDNAARNCQSPTETPDSEQPPTLPLSACEKRGLLNLLRQLAVNYSRQPRAMRCNDGTPAEVRVPAGEVGPVRFLINDENWSNRFSWRGRMTHPTEPGLYALGLDAQGRPTAASFIPAEHVPGERLPDDIIEAETLLVGWRPEGGQHVSLSTTRLPLPDDQRGAGAWVILPGEEEIVAVAADDRPRAVLTIGPDLCESLL